MNLYKFRKPVLVESECCNKEGKRQLVLAFNLI